MVRQGSKRSCSTSPKGQHRRHLLRDAIVRDGRPIVDGVCVNGHGPFRFLLDTGSKVENPGRALTKDEIMEAVWPDSFVSGNSQARAITQIRKALDDDPKAPRYVETVPTVGYRFVGVCRQEQQSASQVAAVASGLPAESPGDGDGGYRP